MRVGRPNGKPESLRSRIWRLDTVTGENALVSRNTGARGEPADGYATDPAISADGRRVAFASTAGNLAEVKPEGIAGVFVRDFGRNTTTLLSTHAQRPGLRPEPDGRGRPGRVGARARRRRARCCCSAAAGVAPSGVPVPGAPLGTEGRAIVYRPVPSI